MNYDNFQTGGPRNWLAQIGGIVLLILILAAGIALSAVFFVVFGVLAMIWAVWFWWQSRHLRKQIRQQQPDIIEVEYEVVHEEHPPSHGLELPRKPPDRPIDTGGFEDRR